MSAREDGLWFETTFTPPPGSKTLTVCFNDGTDWDNNSDANWSFDLGNRYPAIPEGIVVTAPENGSEYDSGTAAVALSGTAVGVTGTIVWTNLANGASGTIPASDAWSIAAIPLATGTNTIQLSGSAPGTETTVVVAADEAANYENWTDGSNAGTGFGPWQLGEPVAGGASYFKATSENNPNLDIGTSAFGLFAANGKMAEVFRNFTEPLTVGQTLYWTFENNWIDETGDPWPYGVGTALQSAGGDTLWQLYFNGGEGTYHQGPEGSETDLHWTGTGLDIAFTLASDTAYSVTVTPLASPSAAQTFTGAVSAPVERLRVWNYSAGTNDNYNLYFDDFQLVAVESTEPVVWAGEVTVIRQPEAGGDDEPIEIGGEGSPNAFTIGEDGVLDFALQETVAGASYAVYVCYDLAAVPQTWQPVGDSVPADGGPLSLSLDPATLPQPVVACRLGYTR